jgi:hypothetical protein
MRTVIKLVLIGAAFGAFSWRHSEPARASHETGEVDLPMIYNNMQRHNVLW